MKFFSVAVSWQAGVYGARLSASALQMRPSVSEMAAKVLRKSFPLMLLTVFSKGYMLQPWWSWMCL